MAYSKDEAVKNLMSVNRKELKQIIDQVSEQDAIEVYDFIGYLNVEDADLIRQTQLSREDREHGRIFGKEAGLDYLRSKVKEFEHEQNV